MLLQGPLTHQQTGEYVVSQARGRLRHAPGVARREDTTDFSAISNEVVLTAVVTPRLTDVSMWRMVPAPAAKMAGTCQLISGFKVPRNYAASLLSTGQMSTLEFHTRNGVAASIAKPDQVVFELDSGEN